MDTQLKHCSKCNRQLPTTSFAKRSRSRDGLQPWCRQCNGATNLEPTYKSQPLKIPGFEPGVWYESFVRTTTCLWCKAAGARLVVGHQVLEPSEEIVDLARSADIWCGNCDRRENLKSKTARRQRADSFDDRVLEAFAWHDSMKKSKRSCLGKNNELPGHNMAVEGFMRRSSHSRDDYFEVIDRYRVLNSKQIKEVQDYECVSFTDESQIDGLMNGTMYANESNRIVNVREKSDY